MGTAAVGIDLSKVKIYLFSVQGVTSKVEANNNNKYVWPHGARDSINACLNHDRRLENRHLVLAVDEGPLHHTVIVITARIVIVISHAFYLLRA